jgi:MFS transporter, putative metabolite transport protein
MVIAYDDAPLRPFHLLVTGAALFGSGIDGFGLGLIGIALEAAGHDFPIGPAWRGALGAASLFGLFFGALITGPIADRHGRRPIFVWNMALVALVSAAQYGARGPADLAVLRFVLGVLLGTDYVVGKTMVGEFCPRAWRGRALGALAVAWAAGYAGAFFVGYGLDAGWRLILLTGALPALVALPLRRIVPETPVWLVSRGADDQARAIIAARLGTGIALPPVPMHRGTVRRRDLFARDVRMRTMVAATFYTCQVIPYFALGTFVTRVLAALHVADGPRGSLVYNAFLLAGAVVGALIVDRVPRRGFILTAFGATFAGLVPLAIVPQAPPGLIVALFAVVAFALSAVSALGFAYLVELFPTHLRASGVGFAIAMSRIGAGVSTFLLPVVMAAFGTAAALLSCAAAVMVGWIVCFVCAPETRDAALGAH